MAKAKSRSADGSKTGELPDIGVAYDAAHISGDEDRILDYEEENDDSCFRVDWRGEFDDLFDDVNSRFGGSPVEPAEPEPGYLGSVQRDDKKASIKSTDRVEVLQAMDKVLKGADEEMRVIAESLRSDTLSVMVKPVTWWKAMDKHFPKEMEKTYVRFKDVVSE